MQPEVMVQHFSLPAVRIVTPGGRGLLHATYKVVTVGGDYVVPRLHTVIPDSVIDDMRMVPADLRGIADDILATLPGLIVADEPRQLIHGDLKISNLIFDGLGHAVGIIDFDTILRHARAIDLGDAFRSWCNRTAEDDPDGR